MTQTKRDEAASNSRPSIKPGDRFGLLTALTEVDKRGSHRMWLCRCNCGTHAIMRQVQLIKRNRSCGCTGGRPIKQDGIDRGYPRTHARVRAERGPASDYNCIDCAIWADTWSYVRGCPNEQYGPDRPMEPGSSVYPYCEHVQHYQPRCHTCHQLLDTQKGMTVRRVRAMLLNRM